MENRAENSHVCLHCLVMSIVQEGDRRRAQPRTFSPDRYPIVGQGWSFTPEKIAVNPAYKDVRPK